MLLLPPPCFSLVVVEGCTKSLKRMHKLMLRRIQWAQPPDLGPGEDAAEEEEEDKLPNRCDLVWEVRGTGWVVGWKRVAL